MKKKLSCLLMCLVMASGNLMPVYSMEIGHEYMYLEDDHIHMNKDLEFETVDEQELSETDGNLHDEKEGM